MTNTYTPIIKTLKRATPKVRIADNIVKEWYVEVLYEYEGNEELNLNSWDITYSERADVEYLGKTPTEYTKDELISLMPADYDNYIFPNHYESFNRIYEIKEEKISDFSVDQLS